MENLKKLSKNGQFRKIWNCATLKKNIKISKIKNQEKLKNVIQFKNLNIRNFKNMNISNSKNGKNRKKLKFEKNLNLEKKF